jgi:hypothetical protein
VLADLGSTNGTWVNQRRLHPGDRHDGVELRDGDEVRFGSVTMRVSMGPAAPETAVRQYAFGDVHGPVQTGDGQQYTAGRDQYVAGATCTTTTACGSRATTTRGTSCSAAGGSGGC